MKFETESLTVFWSSMAASYPNLWDLAFRRLLPFSSTYSCEAAFSQLLHIKMKYRNRLEGTHDLRCAFSETKPRIKTLVDKICNITINTEQNGDSKVKETWKHEPGMNVQMQNLMVWEEVGVWPLKAIVMAVNYDSL